jgi:transposase
MLETGRSFYGGYGMEAKYPTDLTDEQWQAIASLIPPAKPGGRPRAVDTLGLIWGLVVHAGDIQDRDGAKLVLQGVRGRLSRLKLIWTDGGYAGQLRSSFQ